jgi:hypothetical protein
VWLQWEVAELGLAFDGVPEGESAPQTATGAPLDFEARIDGLERDTPYRWRARFRTDHPLFPVSAWFTAQGVSATESMLRTGTNVRAR